ncbi:IPL1-related protein kinase 2 [Seminavis robusta]|uniref:IPL1-related protein kinase 2 n=1 Tax=Seminavis robusta TaxID=568900 RepID=A0A9N8DH69_9STRA|nr:IPL1-related protein kinase 2 [Seminavis robusta]|eukprot:Sro84_g044880.1 IPL1-related protein kinase 2 (458) ;mRNA; f:72009-73478
MMKLFRRSRNNNQRIARVNATNGSSMESADTGAYNMQESSSSSSASTTMSTTVSSSRRPSFVLKKRRQKRPSRQQLEQALARERQERLRLERDVRDKFNGIGPVDGHLEEVRGEHVDEYSLETVLGKGAFGEVRLGRSNSKKMQVAIKLLDKEKMTSLAGVQRANEECRLLRKFSSHPNVIRLDRVFHGEHFIYLVQELADQTIGQFLDGPNMCWADVQGDFLQQVSMGVLGALCHMHKHGVSHGDIHAQNILIRFSSSYRVEASDIRLCDFGCSRQADEKQQHGEGQLHSDRECWAPEMFGREAFDSKAADIWAFGCTLLQIWAPEWYPTSWMKKLGSTTSAKDAHIYVKRALKEVKAIETQAGELVDMYLRDFMRNDLMQFNVIERANAAQALDNVWLQRDLIGSIFTAGVVTFPLQEGQQLEDRYGDTFEIVANADGEQFRLKMVNRRRRNPDF